MVVVAGLLWAGLSGWTEQGGSDEGEAKRVGLSELWNMEFPSETDNQGVERAQILLQLRNREALSGWGIQGGKDEAENLGLQALRLQEPVEDLEVRRVWQAKGFLAVEGRNDGDSNGSGPLAQWFFPWRSDDVPHLHFLDEEALDGDVARLNRLADSRRDSLRFRAVGDVVADEGRLSQGALARGTGSSRDDGERGQGEVLDDNPYLEAATAYYGVGWAADTLAHVRYCESTDIVEPCVVGHSGEVGPFQFMPSTWATTPYAHLDPCDPPTAALAAAWMVSQGRWLEWTCWPR